VFVGSLAAAVWLVTSGSGMLPDVPGLSFFVGFL
jgi:hypothetical protein